MLEVFYSRYNVAGNKIWVVDNSGKLDFSFEVSSRIIDKNYNDPKGFDQLMEISKAEKGDRDYNVKIYNKDGTIAKNCGNGLRCAGRFLYDDAGIPTVRFISSNGIYKTNLARNGEISVILGHPNFQLLEVPLHAEFIATKKETGLPDIKANFVEIGNRHAVFFVDDVDDYNLEILGNKLNNHNMFIPGGINVTLASIYSSKLVNIRTWERGVGVSQACGSASCAVFCCAVQGYLSDGYGKMQALSPGGETTVEWTHEGLELNGDMEFEFSGSMKL